MPDLSATLDFSDDELCLWQVRPLRNLADKIRQREQQQQPVDKLLEKFTSQLEQARHRRTAREQARPEVSYPPGLPISDKRDEIARLINDNQVVILAGETGSGKTTQIPKICLELGRGVRGLIGHTQPRRIAARTVANRIAEELGCQLGDTVGYQVRFTDQVSDTSLVKLMTDGILLTEIQNDPLLLKYDTLIIDEAHERSLNIDFLLGYLKQLLPKRPDLKLIVTSATIDLQKFSEHFNNAPVIEVSGRTYPVEILYRPWNEEYDDTTEAVVGAVKEILTLSKGQGGDILVFQTGERDIRETARALKNANLQHLEILPLYARLSLAEQNRVFQPHKGRRVVLATNVAETSLTVPGIRYVIDPGEARVKRYSLRTKVERLPVEAISQASANQRAGRCGRVAEGVCIRLYSQEDFENRPAFTEAEILRSNLAGVILQMLQMRIGEVRRFPFVDRPDNRLLNDGFKLLQELQAVDKKQRVTPLGKSMQQLPVDPCYARILLEADKRGCLNEALIVVAALAVQDPRDRPAEKQQAADEKHARFKDEHSDFAAFINLWQYAEEQRQALSQNQLRKLCKREFLNFLRLREWRDLHHQLKLACRHLKLKINAQPAGYDPLHQSLVAGLLSNVGRKNEESEARDYLGTRNRRFMIFPGSSQKKKRPRWLVAAEMLETSQLFAHCVAKIEPDWVLASAQHLVKKHYFEPHYDARAGQVKAFVKTSLYGLVLEEKRRVNYGQIDPVEAREVFIRAALVEGKYKGKGEFFRHNRDLIADVEELEAKSRRKDILVDDEVVYEFYHQLIPQDVVNLRGFEHWRKQAEQDNPRLLFLEREMLMRHGATEVTEAQFPDQLDFGELTLPVSYHFEPGHPADGVSVSVPVAMLHLLPEAYLHWLVPGLLRDKCIALMKGLPKPLRKQLVPVPQYADRALARLQRGKQPLAAALTDVLNQLTQAGISEDDWNTDALDDFYRMNIRVVDDRGKLIDQDRSLPRLRERYRGQVQDTLQSAGTEFERDRLNGWDFGELPESVELRRSGVKVKGFPALVDEQGSVALRVMDNPRDAQVTSRQGVSRLAMDSLGSLVKPLKRELLRGKDIGLTMVPLGKREDVVDDILLSAVWQSCFAGAPLPADQSAFEKAVAGGSNEVTGLARWYEQTLLEALAGVVEVKKQMKSHRSALALAMAFSDINSQLANLFWPGFLFDTPRHWIAEYPRYLRAINVRLEKAPQNPQKDKLAIKELEPLWQAHEERLSKEGQAAYEQNELWQEYRWMMEELRVSLFAQTLGTLRPVSAKRLRKLWQDSL